VDRHCAKHVTDELAGKGEKQPVLGSGGEDYCDVFITKHGDWSSGQ